MLWVCLICVCVGVIYWLPVLSSWWVLRMSWRYSNSFLQSLQYCFFFLSQFPLQSGKIHSLIQRFLNFTFLLLFSVVFGSVLGRSRFMMHALVFLSIYIDVNRGRVVKKMWWAFPHMIEVDSNCAIILIRSHILSIEFPSQNSDLSIDSILCYIRISRC